MKDKDGTENLHALRVGEKVRSSRSSYCRIK